MGKQAVNKTKAYRHGEIAFEKIETLPTGLEKSKDTQFLVGSHGHSHSFNGGELYRKQEGEYVIGYFVSKNTILTHAEHGDKKVGNLKQAKLPDGIYRIRVAMETIADELKQVVD